MSVGGYVVVVQVSTVMRIGWGQGRNLRLPVSTPTPLQRRAFELLGVSHRDGLT